VDASWEKERRRRPSHNINIIIFLADKNSKAADKYFRKARVPSGEFVALVIALRLVNKKWSSS